MNTDSRMYDGWVSKDLYWSINDGWLMGRPNMFKIVHVYPGVDDCGKIHSEFHDLIVVSDLGVVEYSKVIKGMV